MPRNEIQDVLYFQILYNSNKNEKPSFYFLKDFTVHFL